MITDVRQNNVRDRLKILTLQAKNNEKKCKAITSGYNTVTLELPQQQ